MCHAEWAESSATPGSLPDAANCAGHEEWDAWADQTVNDPECTGGSPAESMVEFIRCEIVGGPACDPSDLPDPSNPNDVFGPTGMNEELNCAENSNWMGWLNRTINDPECENP